MISKKIVLDVSENQSEFELIGIISQIKSYRLVAEINNFFGIELMRDEDVLLNLGKNKQSYFLSYSAFPEQEAVEIFLWANKGTEGYLVENLKKVDYFIQIKGDDRKDWAKKLYIALKNKYWYPNLIQLVNMMDTEQINKSKNNFLL